MSQPNSDGNLSRVWVKDESIHVFLFHSFQPSAVFLGLVNSGQTKFGSGSDRPKFGSGQIRVCRIWVG